MTAVHMVKSCQQKEVQLLRTVYLYARERAVHFTSLKLVGGLCWKNTAPHFQTPVLRASGSALNY